MDSYFQDEGMFDQFNTSFGTSGNPVDNQTADLYFGNGTGQEEQNVYNSYPSGSNPSDMNSAYQYETVQPSIPVVDSTLPMQYDYSQQQQQQQQQQQHHLQQYDQYQGEPMIQQSLQPLPLANPLNHLNPLQPANALQPLQPLQAVEHVHAPSTSFALPPLQPNSTPFEENTQSSSSDFMASYSSTFLDPQQQQPNDHDGGFDLDLDFGNPADMAAGFSQVPESMVTTSVPIPATVVAPEYNETSMYNQYDQQLQAHQSQSNLYEPQAQPIGNGDFADMYDPEQANIQDNYQYLPDYSLGEPQQQQQLDQSTSLLHTTNAPVDANAIETGTGSVVDEMPSYFDGPEVDTGFGFGSDSGFGFGSNTMENGRYSDYSTSVSHTNTNINTNVNVNNNGTTDTDTDTDVLGLGVELGLAFDAASIFSPTDADEEQKEREREREREKNMHSVDLGNSSEPNVVDATSHFIPSSPSPDGFDVYFGGDSNTTTLSANNNNNNNNNNNTNTNLHDNANVNEKHTHTVHTVPSLPCSLSTSSTSSQSLAQSLAHSQNAAEAMDTLLHDTVHQHSTHFHLRPISSNTSDHDHEYHQHQHHHHHQHQHQNQDVYSYGVNTDDDYNHTQGQQGQQGQHSDLSMSTDQSPGATTTTTTLQEELSYQHQQAHPLPDTSSASYFGSNYTTLDGKDYFGDESFQIPNEDLVFSHINPAHAQRHHAQQQQQQQDLAPVTVERMSQDLTVSENHDNPDDFALDFQVHTNELAVEAVEAVTAGTAPLVDINTNTNSSIDLSVPMTDDFDLGFGTDNHNDNDNDNGINAQSHNAGTSQLADPVSTEPVSTFPESAPEQYAIENEVFDWNDHSNSSPLVVHDEHPHPSHEFNVKMSTIGNENENENDYNYDYFGDVGDDTNEIMPVSVPVTTTTTTTTDVKTAPLPSLPSPMNVDVDVDVDVNPRPFTKQAPPTPFSPIRSPYSNENSAQRHSRDTKDLDLASTLRDLASQMKGLRENEMNVVSTLMSSISKLSME